MLVGAAGTEEEAGGEKIGGEGPGHGHLLVNGGHFGPTVEDVGHVVRAEDVEVFRAQQIRVAHLDAVLPIGRELPEEDIQRGDEIAEAGEVGRIKRGELEDEDAGFRAMGGERSEEGVEEKFGVEEMFVVRSRAVAEAVELGKFFHRDLVGHFVAEAEAIRDLRAEIGQIFLRRKTVVTGVDAD